MSDEAIDLQEVLERVQDDRELLMELFQIYAEDYLEKKKKLDEAVAQNDFDSVKNISHSLKGASGNISAKKIHLSFLALEQMARAKDFSQAPALLQTIDTQFSELQTFIAGLKKG